jgi:hypothetical protein
LLTAAARILDTGLDEPSVIGRSRPFDHRDYESRMKIGDRARFISLPKKGC